MDKRIRTGLYTSSIGSTYTDEEREFLSAIDGYKRSNKRPHPTWQELLAVIHALGYKRDGFNFGKRIDEQRVKVCLDAMDGVPTSKIVEYMQRQRQAMKHIDRPTWAVAHLAVAKEIYERGNG